MSETITDRTMMLEMTHLGVTGDSFHCDGCPLINDDPPLESDCPNFEVRDGIPVCRKEDDEVGVQAQMVFRRIGMRGLHGVASQSD